MNKIVPLVGKIKSELQKKERIEKKNEKFVKIILKQLKKFVSCVAKSKCRKVQFENAARDVKKTASCTAAKYAEPEI